MSRKRPGPVVYFLDELAPLLGLRSASAARRFVLRECIPHVRIGRRLAVRVATLDEWLAAREVAPEGRPQPPPVPKPPKWAAELLDRTHGRRRLT